jgi:hypothetical protein
MAAPIALLVIAIAWRTSVRVAPQPVNSGARADVAASATVMPRASGYDTASTRTAIVEPAAMRPHRPVVRLPIDESRLDALAPAALDIPSIAVRRMAPAAPIAEPPLDVAPLDIAPLGESQGDR